MPRSDSTSTSSDSSSSDSSSFERTGKSSLRDWIQRHRRQRRPKEDDKDRKHHPERIARKERYERNKNRKDRKDRKDHKDRKDRKNKKDRKDRRDKKDRKDKEDRKDRKDRKDSEDTDHYSHDSQYYEKRRNVNGKVDIEVIHERDGVPYTNEHIQEEDSRYRSQGTDEYSDDYSEESVDSRKEQRRICQSNVTTAEDLTEFFVDGKYQDLVEHANVLDNVTLEIVDRSKKIPYAGLFKGREEFSKALAKMHEYIVPTSIEKEDVYINVDCSRIIATVKVNQTNRAFPASVAHVDYEGVLYLTFEFKDVQVKGVKIEFDTGVLSLFYTNNGSSTSTVAVMNDTNNIAN